MDSKLKSQLILSPGPFSDLWKRLEILRNTLQDRKKELERQYDNAIEYEKKVHSDDRTDHMKYIELTVQKWRVTNNSLEKIQSMSEWIWNEYVRITSKGLTSKL